MKPPVSQIALETEIELICSCWMDEDNAKTLLGSLKQSDFHTGAGMFQFEVLESAWRRYRDVSPSSLRKVSSELGGPYLDTYATCMEEHFKGIGTGVGPGHMKALIQQVSEETTRHRLAEALGKAQVALLNRDLTLAEAQAQTSDLLYRATLARRSNRPQSWDEGLGALEEKAQKALEAAEKGEEIQEYIPTGLAPLDEIITGIGVPEFCVLAARPGVGKTAFALQIGTHVAATRGPVLFLTLELSKGVCWKRIASQQLRMRGKDFEKRPDLIRKVREKNHLLFLDDSPLRAPQLRSRVELFLLDHPNCSMVIIDQLSKIVDDPSKHDQMTLGCKRACEITTELKIPVILLAQVGRKAELREDAKPTLYDLKATGSLEEDARKVFFIHRKWTHKPGKCDPREAQVLVPKNGEGSPGEADVLFDGYCYTFSAPPAEPPKAPTGSKGKGKGKAAAPAEELWPAPTDADVPRDMF